MDINSFLAGVVLIQTFVIFVILVILYKVSVDFSSFKAALNGFIGNASEKLYKIEQIGIATMQASEQFVDALDNAMGENTGSMGGPNKQVFRTADGKHVAHSIEDFVKKLESDPEYQSLAHKIKEDLENAIGQFEDDVDEEDDENNINKF
jgi:hypothetical protein